MKNIAVFGAGGHAKVVIDVLKVMGGWSVKGLLDESEELRGQSRWDYTVFGGCDQFSYTYQLGIKHIIIALGENKNRQKIFNEALQFGFELAVAVHPSAQIGSQVALGPGTLIVAGVIVNVDSQIGSNVILNTGSTIDHDCMIGNHAHISPGVHLGGGVRVEDCVHVGIGAVVLPGLTIGKGSEIGGGAVVTKDVPGGVVMAGNPAKVIKEKEGSYVNS